MKAKGARALRTSADSGELRSQEKANDRLCPGEHKRHETGLQDDHVTNARTSASRLGRASGWREPRRNALSQGLARVPKQRDQSQWGAVDPTALVEERADEQDVHLREHSGRCADNEHRAA